MAKGLSPEFSTGQPGPFAQRVITKFRSNDHVRIFDIAAAVSCMEAVDPFAFPHFLISML